MNKMKETLKALIKKFTDKENDLWIENPYGEGDSFQGYTSTYKVDQKKLDAEIDAFCKTFRKEGQ